jgi:hypothetical protein
VESLVKDGLARLWFAEEHHGQLLRSGRRTVLAGKEVRLTRPCE